MAEPIVAARRIQVALYRAGADLSPEMCALTEPLATVIAACPALAASGALEQLALALYECGHAQGERDVEALDASIINAIREGQEGWT
jgi:hypothetical protein